MIARKHSASIRRRATTARDTALFWIGVALMILAGVLRLWAK